MIETRQLHKTILEIKNAPSDTKKVVGYHTHILTDIPEDTDVFHVLIPKTGIAPRDSLNSLKQSATVPRDSNRTASSASPKRSEGVPPGLSWFGTFPFCSVVIWLQALEIHSPNSRIGTPGNIQRTNNGDLLKSPKTSKTLAPNF